MSQHSFSIVNEAGAAFRADINSALQALASCSRGASAPATTYAGQVWDDSTANVQKKRNAANAAWIAKMTLDETFVLARSSNTILGVSDVGKTIVATGTFTQTVTAAATLADGWWVEYRNDGTGLITLDPNSSETIDGATTLVLYPGESCVINCNGSSFSTVGRGTGLVRIQRQSASAVAQVDFTIGIGADFEEYLVTITDLVPATTSTDLWLRVSEDGGSTFKAAGTDYGATRFAQTDAGALGSAGEVAAAQMAVITSITNAAGDTTSGEVRFWNPAGTARRKQFTYEIARDNATATRLCGAGRYKGTTNAINAIRFLMSSGNITSGVFTLYGVRKG